MHPLKTVSLTTLTGLLISQLSLLGSITEMIDAYPLLLALPLLIPIRGFIRDRLYTYRWCGFLSLFYLCVGISELVSNPALKTYAIVTTLLSVLLFVSTMYYARYLSANKRQ